MNLFLTSADEENLKNTIEGSILVSKAEIFLSPTDSRELKRALGNEKSFHCWGATSSTLKIYDSMKVNDKVLFKQNGPNGTAVFRYIGEIFFKAKSEELGKYLWPEQPNLPWTFIYFLRNIQPINLARDKVLEALGYNPTDRVQKLRAVRREELDRIIKTHGSIQGFIDKLSAIGLHRTDYIGGRNKQHTATVTNIIQEPVGLYHEVPDWLQPLMDHINQLRKDREHKERAHESLVESFYEACGWKKYDDIKHRQGRVDISIISGGEIKIVTEIKRDWNLSREDKKIVDQGYRYALETGAKYVVITNGDYYAVFDREKGLKSETNFVGEFKLSRGLTKKELDTVRLISR